MALHNKPDAMHNYHCVDNTTNKVYINPNFNRPTSNTSNAVMHVNPRFSHLLSNVQPVPHNKTRIYVNPNFMKSNCGNDALITNTNCVQPTTITYNTNSLYTQEQLKIVEQKYNMPTPFAKSRYCLVRQNASKLLSGKEVEKPKTTYQINKYKSIPLKDIKRNLDNAKNAVNKQPETTWTKPNDALSINKKYLGSATSNSSRNQYKLVNRNIAPVVQNDKIKMRIELRKKIEINQIRLKKAKGHLKKNNIPCPTFRKFGKCLRKIRGKCEFLHDKKHVAICRKFIKGLCHDKECLLSHDLTAKKMPTCYFYLQGTCTKPDCPYLHVKLNEKVKICPDFLKGYCEKGSKCLLRHVQSDSRVKRSSVRKTSLTSKKKYSKIKAYNLDQNNTKATQGNEISVATEKTENSTDYRYYQEHTEDDSGNSESCKIIKPTRCKLGTLPSFIQL